MKGYPSTVRPQALLRLVVGLHASVRGVDLLHGTAKGMAKRGTASLPVMVL